MTTIAPPCVMGCSRPCRCSACAVTPQHPPIPRRSDTGLLCATCADTLRRWLGEVGVLYAYLDVRPTQGSPQTGSWHQKAVTSPALARTDVMALQDPRTNPIGHIGHPDREEKKPLEFIPHDGPMHIPGEVIGWAQCLVDDLGLQTDGQPRLVVSMGEGLELLTVWFSRVAASPWVDECFAALKRCRSLLGQAHGEQHPKPIGRCLATQPWVCGEALFMPTDGSSVVRCGKCHASYQGAMLLQLAVANIRESA